MKLEGRVLATGLDFAEGPIALRDGSVLVVEVFGGRLTRVFSSGKIELVADTGGGPNGAAIGPDGFCYLCNNGGYKSYRDASGQLRAAGIAKDYAGGSIQRVDLDSGAVETLYTHCGDNRLSGPNDLVFDRHGGFWFTDLGRSYGRVADRGAVYYARADGSMITEAIFPIVTPNGIGLSPDGSTLYVAETDTSRVWAYPVAGEGVLEKDRSLSATGGRLLHGLPGYQHFDSMAVEANGNVCVGTLVRGGVTVFSPEGDLVEFWEASEPYCTNICFGGEDMRTAFVTLGGSGTLLVVDWPRPGLRLNFGR
jgi:gluconolactonase